MEHVLKDAEVAAHKQVQFHCSKCRQLTTVEITLRPDQTMVVSPLPSFARSNASKSTLNLLEQDDGLKLPAAKSAILTVVVTIAVTLGRRRGENVLIVLVNFLARTRRKVTEVIAAKLTSTGGSQEQVIQVVGWATGWLSAFLDKGVPFAAGLAFALPAGRGRTAVLADEAEAAFGHRNLLGIACNCCSGR